MRRAGHQRSVSIRATSTLPPTDPGVATVSLHLLDEQSLSSAEEVHADRNGESTHHGPQQQALEVAVYQRIEARLQGRVRNLSVRAYDDVVVLEGECATFYSKQLAQHAAMGILDDEHLENAIVVNAS